MFGYRHHLYAASLGEYGEPIFLQHSEGQLIKRSVPNSDFFDATGIYPFLVCTDWSNLREDLDELASEDIVSLVSVIDPFAGCSKEFLTECFHDRAFAFKEHYVADMSLEINEIVTSNHRYFARRALNKRGVEVELVQDPLDTLDDWVDLYSVLIERYNITDMRAFSRKAFEHQLSIPQAVVFRGWAQGKVVGVHMWFIDGEIGYHHLVASSELGYDLGASYAMYMKSIEYMKERVAWIGLGARAGSSDSEESGLDKFKKGWSTETRTAYLCGRIYDTERYEWLNQQAGTANSSYFPAYRQGEFN